MYRNSGVRMLRTYNDALLYLQKVKPIAGKGTNAGKIPLGHRNKPQFTLRMRQDESIAARLYDTDVVVFDKDDTISFNTGGHITQTTANFIHDVLNLPCGIYDHDIIVRLKDGSYVVDNKLKIRRNDVGFMQVLEYNSKQVLSINRNIMQVLRKRTKEFRKYLHGMCKLREYRFTRDDIDLLAEYVPEQLKIKDGPAYPVPVPRLKMNIWYIDKRQSLECYEQCMQWINAGHENWHSAALWIATSVTHPFRTMSMVQAEVDAKLDEVLRVTNPSVFETTALPQGKVDKNRYRDYMVFLGLQGETK